MARKRFERAHRDRDNKVEFTIGPLRDGFPDVDFDCNDDIDGGVVLAFAGETIPSGDVQTVQELGAKAMTAVTDLINAAIVPRQVSKFWSMMNGADGGIGVSQLMLVCEYLADAYTGERPTGESLDSTSPPTSSGQDSTAGVSPGVKTYSRSPLGVPIPS